MTQKLKIVLAQLNLTVGDIKGNLQKHIDAANKARDEHQADIIIFPELSITGYPPEDLLLRESFVREAMAAVEVLTHGVTDIYMLFGHPYPGKNGLLNSCSLVKDGVVLGHYAKQYLPNYGVFDEDRYFVPEKDSCVIDIKGTPIGLIICEDAWQTKPITRIAEQGANLILCINASPFVTDKHERRIATLSHQALAANCSIIYVNQIGGQDELIFDGGSMVIDDKGALTHFAGFFNETLMPVELLISAKKKSMLGTIISKSLSALGISNKIDIPNKINRTYEALVLGVRDYVNKNNFPGVLVGVSGGIDSALTLAIAVDALGKDRVHAVTMPSPYTADISNEDARQIADNLGVKLDTISINAPYKAFLDTLTPDHLDSTMDVTHENIQARCRAILLMALSNKTGNLVLTTGNRSEMAVGYCTLYGDMAGGFAPLKDVPKMLVYELAHYRNTISKRIPLRTIERAPSAELSPNQKDEDTLPPYSELDSILEAYLNNGSNINDIVASGHERDTVTKIVNMIRKNEYKRKQAAIGPRINHKSFGKDWRYPATNLYRD